MGGLLHLVHREGDWAGCGPTQSHPRCTKCNTPPISDVNKDLTFKAKDKDKDKDQDQTLKAKDQDKDQTYKDKDQTPKDKDKDKDQTFKAKDQDKDYRSIIIINTELN